MNIHNKAIEQATRILKAAGCEYILQTMDGQRLHHGNLLDRLKDEFAPQLAAPYGMRKDGVTPRIRKPADPTLPFGQLAKHVQQHLTPMQVGDVCEVRIPAGSKMPLNSLHRSVSSGAIHMWGKGSAITTRNNDKNTVEVLRVN